MQQPTGLSGQQGFSATNAILLVLMIAILAKIALGIVPAQWQDYQMTKLIAVELQQANENFETSRELVESINQRLWINSYYDADANDLLVFTNRKKGQLAIKKNYVKTSNLFANVDIVNRFEDAIEPATDDSVAAESDTDE